MITSRKKKNFKQNIVLWIVGLAVLGACLWLGEKTEATVIGVLLLLCALPPLADRLAKHRRNKKQPSDKSGS
jgi:lipoprotein